MKFVDIDELNDYIFESFESLKNKCNEINPQIKKLYNNLILKEITSFYYKQDYSNLKPKNIHSILNNNYNNYGFHFNIYNIVSNFFLKELKKQNSDNKHILNINENHFNFEQMLNHTNSIKKIIVIQIILNMDDREFKKTITVNLKNPDEITYYIKAKKEKNIPLILNHIQNFLKNLNINIDNIDCNNLETIHEIQQNIIENLDLDLDLFDHPQDIINNFNNNVNKILHKKTNEIEIKEDEKDRRINDTTYVDSNLNITSKIKSIRNIETEDNISKKNENKY